METGAQDFTVTFTEDKRGFYINGRKFTMDDVPMLTVQVGSMQTLANCEPHKRSTPLSHSPDSLLGIRPKRSSIGFPRMAGHGQCSVRERYCRSHHGLPRSIIKGMSLFHCHLLSHEDKGMMAKILFK